jgi:hypothetical protein
MPSSYSPDLRIELIANGEQSGTWGTTTNTNLGTLIEDAIAGLASVSVTSADQALTAANGSADQARCAAVSLTTTTTAAFNVYVPPVPKLYVIRNASAYTATIYCSTVLGNTTAAGTGVAIPANKSVLLRSDGTNIVEQLNQIVGNFDVGGNATVTGDTAVTGNLATSSSLVVIGGSSLGVEQAATISIGTPAVVTVAASPPISAPVVFKTSGALPTGLTAGTVYFVLATGRTATDFRVSTSIGGSAVNTTGAGSGTHAVYTAAFTSTAPAGTTDTQVATTQFASTAAVAGGKFTNAINYATPVTVASAATTDIGAAASNVVNVTGTTTITSFGTIAAGAVRIVNFAGALTLTYNATSLILPGSANIVTVAGDVGVFESLGSGNWQCVSYTKRNAAPGQGGLSNISTAIHPTTVANSSGSPMANTGTGTFTFTVPVGVSRIKITATGGGGNGGNASSNAGAGSRGGGAGGVSILSTAVTSGQVLSITVGAATGTTSVSSTGIAITCAGGFGSTGGAASGGTINIAGSNGSAGSLGTAISNGGGGGGASTIWGGAGGGGLYTAGSPGQPATGYGSGGGGAGTGGTGGAGGVGIVVVEY